MILIGLMFTGTVAKAQRKRKSSENDAIKSSSRKEDVENKQGRKSTRNSCNRGAKKKVLEEANNSKLRQHVRVRVEDCLQNGQRLSALCRRPSDESRGANESSEVREPAEEDSSSDGSRTDQPSREPEPEPEPEPEVVQETVQTPGDVSTSEEVQDTQHEAIEKTEEREADPVSEEDDCVIVSEEKGVQEEPTPEQTVSAFDLLQNYIVDEASVFFFNFREKNCNYEELFFIYLKK